MPAGHLLCLSVIFHLMTCLLLSATEFPFFKTEAPGIPFLELGGRRILSGSSGPPPSSLSVPEKRVISLRCAITASSSSAVRVINWYISDHNVTNQSQFLMEYSAATDEYSSLSILTLNVTKDLHGQRVTCLCESDDVTSASHRPASLQVTALFDVMYEPSFSISREPGFGYPIVAGMTVTLKCEIDANPWCQPTWIKDTSKSNISIADMESPPLRTDEEGSFTILSAKESDSGWYRCVCDHELGVDGHSASYGYFLNVRSEDELPQLQQVLKLPLSPSAMNSMTSGQNGRDAVGDPLRPQQERTSSSPSHHHHADPGSSPASGHSYPHESSRSYNLMQSFYEDKQRALCGDKEGMPLIVSINRSISAIADRPISLVAEFCCNPRPRKVFWIHRHLALAPGRIIGPYITKDLLPADNSRSCFTSTFDIDSVKPEDSGTISFIVANSKGLDDVELSLNVTRAGFSVSRGSETTRCGLFLATCLILVSCLSHSLRGLGTS